MDLDIFQTYLSNDEASHIMQALDNRIRFHNGEDKSRIAKHCSHSHEKEFLNKYDRGLVKECRNIYKNINLWYLLQRRVKFLCSEDPSAVQLEAELLRLTEDMNYTETLLFCANILIDFHFDFNCSEYMPLALKLYLNAYKMTKFFDKLSNGHAIILTYLRYIFSNYKFQRELFIEYVEEFFCGDNFNIWEDIFHSIEEVFDLSNKLDYDFSELLNASQKEYIQKSILKNCERFIILARHGFVDRYYKNAVEEYKEALMRVYYQDPYGFENLTVQENNNVMYRSIQVVFLYLKCIYGKELDYSRVIGDQTLRLVWEATPDPFLSKSQFLGCFEELPAGVQPRLHDAWNWYQEIVMTAPRSLKHLSRSAIRQRLTACSQFPEGVQSLKLPELIKNYLCLI